MSKEKPATDSKSLSLPPAETIETIALSYKNDLIIFVAGFVSGVGGTIVVKASPIMINPPEFVALAADGNKGITGKGLDRIPTSSAYSFTGLGNLPEILFTDSETKKKLSVTKVKSAQDTTSTRKSDHEPSPGKWKAIQDFRTVPPTLRVRGNPLMPTPGYVLTLLKASPQGFNQRDLLLNLKEEPPNGPAPDVVTPTLVSYSEQGKQEYDSVKIQPDGPDIPVEKLN